MTLPSTPAEPPTSGGDTVENPAASLPWTPSAPKGLKGCYLRTPYGWGICTEDVQESPCVEVALNWRLRNKTRVRSIVRRSGLLGKSFCAVGDCVLTRFGTGVLLDFRCADEVHHVQLWGPLGRHRSNAFLKREALLAVIPAATGLVVETPFGQGTCRGVRSVNCAGAALLHGDSKCAAGTRFPAVGAGVDAAAEVAGASPPEALQVCEVRHYAVAVYSQRSLEQTFEGRTLVEFPSGCSLLHPEQVRCPVALAMPLIAGFLSRAAALSKAHAGTLMRVREALQGLGLGKLQEKLTSKADEAVGKANEMLAEVDKLSADEVIADTQLKAIFSAGVTRLNKLVSKAGGLDGKWVGKDDREPRCVIKDALISWHWGEKSELQMVSDQALTMELQGAVYHGTVRANGEVEWSDGDVWIRASVQSETEPVPEEDGQHMAVLKRSLGDLRRLVSGDFIEGDLEDALSALTKAAESDQEVQELLHQMRHRKDLIVQLRGEVMDSKAGQVLMEGKSRLEEQMLKLQETEIAPQLVKVQESGKRIVTRLTSDRRVQSKAAQLFTAAQTKVMERWSDADSGAEAWVTRVKERVLGTLNEQRAMLARCLGGIDVKEMDIGTLVASSWDPAALERHLELSIVHAANASGMTCTSTELLDRFESSAGFDSIPGLNRTCASVVATLADLNVDVPLPLRKLLEAQVAGDTQDAQTWKTALVESLDDDAIVQNASKLVEQGEKMISNLQGIQGCISVVSVMETLAEDKKLENRLLERFQNADPNAVLNKVEHALTSTQARDALIGELTDSCLEFILQVLPAIHVEHINGENYGFKWVIRDISFSDFRFRKENVRLTVGTPQRAEKNFLRLNAWDISAEFRNLQVSAAQQTFPFFEAEGCAFAKAEHMSLSIAFALETSEDGQPQLSMSSSSVLMENLGLCFTQSNYSMAMNVLSAVLEGTLKGMACKKINDLLDKRVGALIDSMNSIMERCLPLLACIGWTPSLTSYPQAGAGPGAAVASAFIGEAPMAEFGTLGTIDWPDPGRCVALHF